MKLIIRCMRGVVGDNDGVFDVNFGSACLALIDLRKVICFCESLAAAIPVLLPESETLTRYHVVFRIFPRAHGGMPESCG